MVVMKKMVLVLIVPVFFIAVLISIAAIVPRLS